MVQVYMNGLPGVREKYERDLGRFLLTFNALDLMLGELLRRIKIESRDPNIYANPKGMKTAERIACLKKALELPIAEELKGIDVPRLRKLNTERNNIAHGHFALNVLDGTFRIVAARDGKAQRSSPSGLGANAAVQHELDFIDNLVRECIDADDQLMSLLIRSRYASASFDEK